MFESCGQKVLQILNGDTGCEGLVQIQVQENIWGRISLGEETEADGGSVCPELLTILILKPEKKCSSKKKIKNLHS